MRCTCGKHPKVVYTDKKEAGKIAVMMSRSTGTVLKPYRCPVCRQWCIGHAVSAERRAEIRTIVQSGSSSYGW